MSKIKVVHYINQFFAQIGGEEKADYPAEIRVGEVVGPGLALTQNFKDEAEIIATVICGDSYFNENLEKAKAECGKEDVVLVFGSLSYLGDVIRLERETNVFERKKEERTLW